VVGENLTELAKEKISKYNFLYSDLAAEEHEMAINQIKEATKKPPIISGKHRKKDWESGWRENALAYLKSGSLKEIVPKYFNKFPYVRWNNKLIKPETKNFEYEMLCALQYQVFSRWFHDCSHIYEFGCGTGHNLLRVNEAVTGCNLYGLDWSSSSQELIEYLKNDGKLDCDSAKFDFFNPNYEYKIEENSGIYTMAALEQVGQNFKPFVDFLLYKKPRICVNIEPLVELFSPSDLELDRLCVKYCERRNYLTGYLSFLRELEKDGKINILQCNRNSIGSLFIEGYSILVWQVK
jgi:SAM-dependent methyltransferase